MNIDQAFVLVRHSDNAVVGYLTLTDVGARTLHVDSRIEPEFATVVRRWRAGEFPLSNGSDVNLAFAPISRIRHMVTIHGFTCASPATLEGVDPPASDLRAEAGTMIGLLPAWGYVVRLTEKGMNVVGAWLTRHGIVEPYVEDKRASQMLSQMRASGWDTYRNRPSGSGPDRLVHTHISWDNANWNDINHGLQQSGSRWALIPGDSAFPRPA